MDFGELKDDKAVQDKLLNFQSSVNKIDKILDTAFNTDVYEKLSLKEKVDYDLFIAYTLDTLFWMYLRSKGQDPNSNDIKTQLSRIKEYMLKAKQAHERLTLRPKIDQPAASRFIKHGVNYKEKPNAAPPNKKTKFN